MKRLHADTTSVCTEVDLKGSVGVKGQMVKLVTASALISERFHDDLSEIDRYRDNNFRAIFEYVEFEDPTAADQVFRAVKSTIEFFRSRERFDYSLIIKIELGWHNSLQKTSEKKLPRRFRATATLRGCTAKQRITIHVLDVLDYLPTGRFLRNLTPRIPS